MTNEDSVAGVINGLPVRLIANGKADGVHRFDVPLDLNLTGRDDLPKQNICHSKVWFMQVLK